MTEPFGDLTTPRLLLDRERLERNSRRMRDRAEALGVRLRQHVKTAKSVDVARIAAGGDRGAITVSTLAEAEHFLAAGFTDILYAVGLTLPKLRRARELALGHPEATLTLILDSVHLARQIAASAPAEGPDNVSFAIEVDSGQGRGGVSAGSDALVAIAHALAPAGLPLRGVVTHGGHSYDCRSRAEMAAIAEHERASAARAAERLRAEGFDCAMVSVGSTPTALFAEQLEGITELRAGVYVFFDLFQQAIGCCAREDLALSVLATVISQRAEERAVWIDAGTLALSSERSLDRVGAGGYGEVTRADGSPLPGSPRVVSLNQEHGKVAATEGELAIEDLLPGTLVRVWPNHACITAAMHDHYLVLERGEIGARWPRLRG